MTSVLHSTLHPHALPGLDAMGNAQVYAHAWDERAACAQARRPAPGAAVTPRGGSIGRRGPADEFEGPHHGRESKNPGPSELVQTLVHIDACNPGCNLPATPVAAVAARFENVSLKSTTGAACA